MSDEDDREMRAESKDNDRFAGDKKTPGKLHSKEANTRMGGGKAGRDGSGSMGDDDVTLAGLFGDAVDVSKQNDRDDAAGSDVEEIANDLLQLEDKDTAMAIARVIVRTADTIGELNASQDSAGTRMNDRMESAD